jgi:PAS domain S-box-containing protein
VNQTNIRVATDLLSLDGETDARLRVLLIEDSAVDAILVEAMLADSRCTVFDCARASSLAQARAALANSIPACVMLDLGLPDSDGLATLDQVLQAAPDVAIVVLTGLDDERSGQAAILRGAQDYLVKGKIDAALLARSLDYAVARKRCSLSLRESEGRYRALVEAAPDAVVVHTSGTIAYVNPAWVRLVGGTRAEEFIGRSMLDFLMPTDAVWWPSTDGDTPRAQARLVRSDQSTVEVELVSTLVSWQRQPARQTILRDLTAQRQAERALRESEARYRSLFEHNPDAIFAFDLTERVTSVNSAAERLSGHPASALIGKPFFSLPEDIERVNAHFARAVAGEPQTVDLEIAHAAGRRVGLTLTLMPMVIEGRTTGVFGVALDMTAAQEAQTALRESEARYRTLVEAAPTAILVRSQGRVIYGNPALRQLLGAPSADDAAIQRFADQVDAMCRAMDDTIATLPALRIQRHGGSFADVEVTVAPILWQGQPAMQVIGRDVTQRKEAEKASRRLNAQLDKRVRERTAELEEANKELEAFAYSVSHDLRAPLRSIDGFSQILLEDCADSLDSAGHDSLHRIQAAARRMAALIDGLLDLSRVTRADIHPAEVVDLSELAASITHELRANEPLRRTSIHIPDGLVASGDPILLRAVLENLLSNAWKFTRPKPNAQVEIGAAQIDGQTAYYVRDNGVGFDMAYADRLFGAFQRLHKQTEFAGTGIGLATVQRIVRRHGGHVWAEAHVGEGATFWFTLGRPSNASNEG